MTPKLLKRFLIEARSAPDGRLRYVLRFFYYNLLRVNSFIVYEWDLKENPPARIQMPPGFEIKVIHGSILSTLIQDHARPFRELYMHEINGVRKAVLVTSSKKIAHIAWIYTRNDNSRWFDLAPDEAQLNYIHTVSEFRRRGLYMPAVYYVGNWLANRGFSRLFMQIHDGNIHAIRAQEKLPFKVVGKLRHWFLFKPKYKHQVYDC